MGAISTKRFEDVNLRIRVKLVRVSSGINGWVIVNGLRDAKLLLLKVR